MISKAMKGRLKEFGYAWIFKEVYYRIRSDLASPVNIPNWLQEQLLSFDGLAYDKVPIFKDKNDDVKMVKILRWVVAHIKYTRDFDKWRKLEYWQRWDETILSGTGDCEDMTTLVYAIAFYNHINVLQMAHTCGKVVGGGHCWLEYQAFEDNISYLIDAAYWPDLDLIPNRETFSSDSRYLTRWWRTGVTL